MWEEIFEFLVRLFGALAGLITLFLDMGKATLSLWLCHMFVPTSILLLLGFCCVFFHCYSIFLAGKGGKGVASAGGVLLYFSPMILVYVISIWLLVQFSLRKSSVSSLIATLASIFLVYILQPFLISLVWAMTFLIIWRHKSNILRLWNKEELSF